MNINSYNKIMKHYIKYFHVKETIHAFSPNDNKDIVCVIFEPNDIYPFWKLCTLGTNQYTMKLKNNNKYNEYVMFIDKSENLLENTDLRNWYLDMLFVPVNYTRNTKEFISYKHDLLFDNTNEEMIGICLLLPEIINDASFLFCKTLLFKSVMMLQVMPITKFEKDILYNDGFEVFEKLFYSDNRNNARPFAQRYRVFKDL